MSDALRWFRMHAEWSTDPKVQSMSEAMQRRLVMLLCMKCSGEFPCETEIVACALRITEEEWLETVELFTRRGFLNENGDLRNWEKRQYKSDKSTERVREFRKRFRNVTETPSETDTESESESESKTLTKNNSQSDAPRGSRKRSPRQTACRLPEDFTLTDERRLVAEAERLPAERTFAKFVDYWRSASGAKARKLDWEATWRNWCRTEADRSGGRGAPAPMPRKPPTEAEIQAERIKAAQQNQQTASRLNLVGVLKRVSA